MEDLVGSMTLENPANRPQIEEVLQRFKSIRTSLSEGRLRSTIISRKVPKFFGLVQRARQSFRTIQYILSFHAAIPDPDLRYASRLT